MKSIIYIAILAMAVSCKTTIKSKAYPESRKDTTVVDNYFGTQVADPYRYLEDDRSEESAAWVTAQNIITQDYLGQIPYRDGIKKRLTELFNYPRYSAPTKQGEYYFFSKNDGLQNQSVLYRQRGMDGAPEVFLDPNTLSSDGTAALTGISFSKDKKMMAYSIAKSGSDWNEIRVMDVETGKQLADSVKWVKFSMAEWCKDGFYYSRYDEPKGGGEFSNKNEFQKVYFHKIGTPQSEDKLIYSDKEHPLRYFTASVSEDDKYLFINCSEGTNGNEILFKPINTKSDFKVLFKGFSYDYEVVHCEGDRAIFFTNNSAPNFRLVQVNLADKTLAATDFIAEKNERLEGASTGGGYVFASYLKDASSVVYQHDMSGKEVRQVTLPGIGTASGFGGDKEESTIFYTFTSFNYPPTIFSYDLAKGASTIFRKPEVKFNPDDFVVEQKFFGSADGTLVPMFIVHKKGLKRDGKNATNLYGYGGFNISVTPSFNASNILFMEQGGVYVVANLRGGGEYGERWHQGGMLDKKQNVFDDFIAAAEYLIKEGYTSPAKLAISGGSNGGLLVGACMVQRPDLFAVAIPRVGVLDMLRYHKFTIGWGWAVEYGSSDNAEQFKYLYKYSPLHNIKKGVCYPATLVMTGDHDDRVVPAHSFKFAATLQENQGCEKPVLIRIDTNAGHGAGKPVSKSIDESADMLSFIFENTGSSVKFK